MKNNRLEEKKAAEIFDQTASKQMLIYNKLGFRRTHPTLFRVIINAMLEFKKQSKK